MNNILFAIILAGATSAFGCAATDQEESSGSNGSALGDGNDEACDEQADSEDTVSTRPSPGPSTSPGLAEGNADTNKPVARATAVESAKPRRTCKRNDDGAPRACAVATSLKESDPAEFERQLAECRAKAEAWEKLHGKSDPNPGNEPPPGKPAVDPSGK